MTETPRSDVVAVLNHLPVPVAGAMRRALNAKSPVDRHHLAYFAAEAMLKIAASARIGTYLSGGPRPGSTLLRRLDCLVQPSSGHWLELLRRLSDSLPEVTGAENEATQRRNLMRSRTDWTRVARFIDAVLSEGVLHKNAGQSARREGALGFFTFLVAYRNEIIGHGAQRSSAFYQSVGDLLVDALFEVLPDETLLGRLQLAVRQMKLSGQHAGVEGDWLMLHGLATLPVSGQQSFPQGKEALTPGRVYLVGGTAPIPLYPLVAYTEEESGLERVGLLNRVGMKDARSSSSSGVEVNRVDYLDYASGQSFSSVDALEGVAQLVSLARDTVVDEHALSVVVLEARDEALKSDVIDLAPGSIIGDFEIEQELGRGGMGVVYRARQRSLDRAVALKLLLPNFSRDREARARFLREAQSQAAIEHRNVVRVYSFGEAEGLPHFAMELVPGGSLAESLEVTTKLPIEKAFAISAQVAEGLAAAWRQKVIHRDVKPSNIMFDSEGNALVADFGLAKPVGVTEGQGLTVGKHLMGTPLYMSPEQAQGDVLDFRSDIYSLGIVLFEMLAGQRPFSAQTPFAVLEKQIHEPLPSLKAVRSEVSEGVVRLVERMTAKRSDDRPRSYDELIQAIGSLRAPAAVAATVVPAAAVATTLVPARVETQRPQTTSRRWMFIALGLVAIAALGVGVVAVSRRTPPSGAAQESQAAAPVRMRRTVLVLGFKNLGRADAASTSNLLVESIQTDLASDEKLHLVTGGDVARMKRELEIVDENDLSREMLSRMSKNYGVDYVVAGSYVTLGTAPIPRVDLNIRLIEAATGEFVAFRDSEKADDLSPLVSRVDQQLRPKLGLGKPSSAEVRSAEAALPRDPFARRNYSDGKAKLENFDPQAARGLLETAVQTEPDSAVIHAALSRAYGALGFDLRAQDEAQKAFDLAEGLPQEEKLKIKAQLAETQGNWLAAADTYRSLFDVYQDLNYGVSLVNALTNIDPQRALETVASLRQLQPAAADARLDLAEAATYKKLTDWESQRKSADAAVSKAKEQSARLLEARARLQQADALVQLSKLEEGRRLAELATGTFAAIGDQATVAQCELVVAASYRKAQKRDLARQHLQAACDAFKSIGDRKGIGKALINLGSLLDEAGDKSEGIRFYDEAILTLQPTGNIDLLAAALNNKGAALKDLRDYTGARGLYESALKTFEDLGAKKFAATALANLGEVLYLEGRTIEAGERYERAIKLYQETSGADPLDIAEALLGMAKVLRDERSYDRCGEMIEQTIASAREADEPDLLARALKEKARLKRDRGLPNEAIQCDAEAAKVEAQAGKGTD